MTGAKKKPLIEVKGLNLQYGNYVLMHDINCSIYEGDVFVIMGGSGCGKSTMLRVLTGLKRPEVGQVIFEGVDFWRVGPKKRDELMRNAGILYQSGALFSSMTLGENIALPMQQYTKLSKAEIKELVALKLSLVGLGGFEEYYPSELSGGMKKRAGLARALALDPKIVFFDEPSAGLDPLSAKLLDDLILEIKESLGTTIVFVSHELASIFAIANNSIYLDVETQKALAHGNPHDLLKNPPHPNVLRFLTRGKKG